MKIIIGNQTYESKSWDQPILASKKVKNKIVDLIIGGNHEFKDFPELIILDKYNKTFPVDSVLKIPQV